MGREIKSSEGETCLSPPEGFSAPRFSSLVSEKSVYFKKILFIYLNLSWSRDRAASELSDKLLPYHRLPGLWCQTWVGLSVGFRGMKTSCLVLLPIQMPINGEKVHFSRSRPCVNVLGGLFAFNFQHLRSVDQRRFSMVEHGTIWGTSRPRVRLSS